MTDTTRTVHPTKQHLTRDDWRRILQQEDQLAAILRELIRVGNTPVGRGPRPAPNPYTTQLYLDRLTNPPEPVEHTNLPFPEALDALRTQYSTRGIAHRTGIPRPTIQYWITHRLTPNLATQIEIATALKKPETYFLETRHEIVSAWLTYQLEANPTTAQHIIDHIRHQSQ